MVKRLRYNRLDQATDACVINIHVQIFWMIISPELGELAPPFQFSINFLDLFNHAQPFFSQTLCKQVGHSLLMSKFAHFGEPPMGAGGPHHEETQKLYSPFTIVRPPTIW